MGAHLDESSTKMGVIHFNSLPTNLAQGSKNRFKKIGDNCLSQITSFLLGIIGKISSFISNFIWPVPENQSKNLPTLKELVEGGKERYEGLPKTKALVVYQILDTPKILDKQVALFPEEYKQQFKFVQRMGQFLGTFAMCQSNTCSPGKALSCLEMTRYQLNLVTDPLGILLPSEMQYTQWAYEKRCQTVAEVAAATAFLSISNESQAKKVNLCIQFIFLGAATFPEIQNYIPQMPRVNSAIQSVEGTLSSIHSKAKELFIRPLIKKYVMPSFTNKIVSITENVGASWILDKLDLILDEYIRSLDKQVKEMKAINDRMTNPYVSAEGETDLSLDGMNRSDSILANVTGLMIDQHFSEPVKGLIGKAFQKTEDIFTDLAMYFVMNQVKELAWSYLIPNSKDPFIACGITSVLGISMPLFKGVVLVVNGGREQSIGQLGTRILGATVAIQSGSFLLGNMLVYGCFLGKYAIKLRKKHFERMGMQDPLIELMDSVVEISKKQFLEIGPSIKSEIKKSQIRNDIEEWKQKQKIVKQNKEKRKIIKAKRANSYSPKSYSQDDEGRYTMEEIFVPTMGSNGKMRCERTLKFKAKPQYVLRTPEVKVPKSNFGSFAKNKFSE